MTRCSPALAAAALLTAVPAALAQQDPLGALRSEYVLHYNAGHPDAVAALFAEDAVVMSGQGVTRGRDAIREELAAELAQLQPRLEVAMEGVMISGDQAVERGRYAVTVTPPESAPQVIEGSYVVVGRREGGGWKIAWAITSDRHPEGM